MRRLTITVLAVASLAALSACGDDSGVTSDTSAGTGTTSTTAAPATTDTADTGTAATTTTTSAPATTEATTVPPTEPATTAPPTEPPTTEPVTEPTDTEPEETDVACGALPVLQDTARVTSTALVDWDGDGEQSATATVYETDSGNRDFRLRVEGEGDSSEVALIVDDIVEPVVLGPVQVDFSLGSDQPQPEELLLTVGNNSSGFNVGVFFRDDSGCLGRFTNADESPAEFPIHASIGSSSGLACEGAAGSQFLVRTTATATGTPNEYDVHDIRLRRDGTTLVDDVDIPGTITDDGTPDSPIVRYSSITNCAVSFGDD